MQKLVFSILFIFFVGFVNGQELLGTVPSNYAGVLGIHHQPACIVDSRLAFDLNLVTTNIGFGNNYIGFRSKEIIKNTDFDIPNLDATFLDTTSDFADKYLVQLQNDRTKKFFFNTTVYGPSFMFSIKNKHAFAITTAVRTYFNMNELSAPLADKIWDAVEGASILNEKLEGDGFSLQGASWGEIGLTYGTVLVDDKKHFLKGALRTKYIRGLGGFYFYADDLNFQLPNDSTVEFASADFSYGHSKNLNNYIAGESVSLDNIFDGAKASVGFDMGFEYEFRPKYKDYYYYMNNDSFNVRHDQNQYKFKVGLSLTDIGKLRFDKGILTHDFSVSSSELELDSFRNINSVEGYDSAIISQLQTTPPPDVLKYSLPTKISLQFDYHVVSKFYINLSMGYAFQPKRLGSRELSRIALIPRWEQSLFEAAVPFSYDGNGQFNIGAHLRLIGLTIGSNNILSAVFSNKVQTGANFYVGLKIPIRKKMLKDRDGDFVSNKFDECRKVPGTWEHQGCPAPIEPEPTDRDGDTVFDKDDECPDDAGLVVFNGCPDTDNDQVPDNKDKCPQDSGMIVFNGCPDTDLDSVPDITDSCPDVYGLIELNGCPVPEAVEDTVEEVIDQLAGNPNKAVDCFENMSDDDAYVAAVRQYGKKKMEGLSYRVQIGAFSKPPVKSYYNFLENVGPIEQTKENGLTKFKVGNAQTLEEIEILRKKVVNQGVKDAFVAPYINGEQVSLRRMINELCK